MTWKKKYRLVGITPGPLVTRQFGELNFANDNLPIEKLDKLYESGCRFLAKVEQKPAKKGFNLNKEEDARESG
jgi:hypothetical protein